jgi:hypothetical protein
MRVAGIVYIRFETIIVEVSVHILSKLVNIIIEGPKEGVDES